MGTDHSDTSPSGSPFERAALRARAEVLFQEALDLPAEQRGALLDTRCEGDALLRREVSQLLELYEDPGTTLDHPMGWRVEPRGGDTTLDQGGSGARPLDAVKPETIPGYSIKGEIHRGGQGVVYEAVQESTQRSVAIKVLKEGPFAGPADRARFEREVQVLGQLKHPHIVTVHDSGMAGGHYYLVMDYIAGATLDDHLATKKLSVDDVVQLFLPICDAVNDAHLRGVIHRDIKPGNIRIDEEGRPHVLDFGLAKFTTDDSGAHGLTETGQFLGSVPWATPEQAEGRPDKIDVRTDVYALGVVLFQMLTGRFPYEVKGNIRDVLDRVMSSEPLRPRTIRREINDEVETIALKCLSKERERRYQSAGDLARDLRRYLAGEPIEAKRDSRWYVMSKTLKRYRGTLSAAAAVLLALLGGLAGTLYGLFEAREREQQLTKVAGFQQRMLADLDAGDMGASLVRDIRDSLDSNLEAQGIDAEARQVQLDQFDLLAHRFTATDVAQALLNEHVLKPAVEAVERDFSSQPVTAAMLRESLASIYDAIGLPHAALEQQQEALALRSTIQDPQSPEILRAREGAVELLRKVGDWAAAESLAREMVEEHTRVFGPEHPTTVETVRGLCNVLLKSGKLEEAEQRLREIVDRGKSRPRGPDGETWASMEQLAMAVAYQGRDAEAEPLYREALQGMQAAADTDELGLITCMGSLASCLSHLGKYDEAEAILREAISVARGHLGEDHAETLNIYNSLAIVFYDLGRWEECEKLYRRVLEARRRVQGERHQETLTAMHNLGMLLLNQHRIDDAAPLLEGAADGRLFVLGKQHHLTLQSITAQGLVYDKMGRLQDAEPLYHVALDGLVHSRGETHQDTVAALFNLARLYRRLERADEAETMFRRTLAALEQGLGADHLYWNFAANEFGGLLQSAGRLDEAGPLLVGAMEKQLRNIGTQHPNTQSFIADVENYYASTKNAAAQQALYERLIERYTSDVGPHGPPTLHYTRALADLYIDTAQEDAGRSLYESLIKTHRELAERDGATPRDLLICARVLLKCPVDALCDAPFAVTCAERAVTLSERQDVAAFVTWADALQATGDRDAAGEALSAAFELLPEDATEDRAKILGRIEALNTDR